MAAVVTGGLRLRFLADAMYVGIKEELRALGWFEPTVHDTPPGTRQHQPVRFVHRPIDWDEPVKPNMLSLSIEGVEKDDGETGSNLTFDMTAIQIAIFGESDSILMEISNDIRDILRGRMGTRFARAVVRIVDPRDDLQLGYATLDEPRVVRNPSLAQPNWKRSWVTVTVIAQDCYHLPDEQRAP